MWLAGPGVMGQHRSKPITQSLNNRFAMLVQIISWVLHVTAIMRKMATLDHALFQSF